MALYHRGLANLRLGRTEDAKKDFQKAEDIGHSNPMAKLAAKKLRALTP